MDDFNAIRLKRKVIERFKAYSKKTSPSYSETLDYMITFFEDTGLSPYDTINHSVLSFTSSINKRLNALTSILRDIEKTQLIPTREKLESLFENIEEEEPEFVEKKWEEIQASKTEDEKLLDFYTDELDKTKRELTNIKNEFSHLLNKLSYVKSTFSKSYHKLDMSEEEIEQLKTSLI